MKRLKIILLLLLASYTRLVAQNTDMELAKQFSANGEEQKAFEIYQRLYKTDNDTYFPNYLGSLLALKKLPDAEAAAKKMMKKHPDDFQYAIALGKVYK